MTASSLACLTPRNAIGIVTRMGRNPLGVRVRRTRARPAGIALIFLSLRQPFILGIAYSALQRHGLCRIASRRPSSGLPARGAARSARLDLSLQHIGTFKELKVSKV